MNTLVQVNSIALFDIEHCDSVHIAVKKGYANVAYFAERGAILAIRRKRIRAKCGEWKIKGNPARFYRNMQVA